MAKMQSWTLDKDTLDAGLRSAAQAALDSIRSLVLIQSGKTRNEGLLLNNQMDVYIDLEVVPYMSYDNPHAKQMETWDTAIDKFAAEKAKNYVKPMLPKAKDKGQGPKHPPRKGGNLRNNALKVRLTQDGIYEIYIDYLVAPYAAYPNVDKIIQANWPIIRTRFENSLYGTIAARSGGLYNNAGAVKVIGGGYYDDEGEFVKSSLPGQPSRWDYRRYN
jgi:hypothetical protein